MLRLFVIGFGGAIGAILRYAVGGVSSRFSNGVFPVSTLVVNVTGSLAIGFLWGFFDRFEIAPGIRSFLLIGFLGAYTTFSTFSLETFNLMRDGEYRIALINVVLSVSAGIVAVFAGYVASKILMNMGGIK